MSWRHRHRLASKHLLEVATEEHHPSIRNILVKCLEYSLSEHPDINTVLVHRLLCRTKIDHFDDTSTANKFLHALEDSWEGEVYLTEVRIRPLDFQSWDWSWGEMPSCHIVSLVPIPPRPIVRCWSQTINLKILFIADVDRSSIITIQSSRSFHPKSSYGARMPKYHEYVRVALFHCQAGASSQIIIP